MRFKTETAAAAILALALGTLGAPAANAAPIVGGIGVDAVGGVTASPSSDDLFAIVASLGSLTFNTLVWTGGGTGGFAAIPAATSINSPQTLALSNLGNLTLTSVDGTFAATNSITVGGPIFTPSIIGTSGSSTNESATIYLVGHFTPAGTTTTGADLGDTEDTATLTMALTQTCSPSPCTGSDLNMSMSATLSAPGAPPPPPPEVPEPASLTLLGAGLFGLGAFRRRKG